MLCFYSLLLVFLYGTFQLTLCCSCGGSNHLQTHFCEADIGMYTEYIFYCRIRLIINSFIYSFIYLFIYLFILYAFKLKYNVKISNILTNLMKHDLLSSYIKFIKSNWIQLVLNTCIISSLCIKLWKYKEGNNRPSSVNQIPIVHNHDKSENKCYTQDNTKSIYILYLIAFLINTSIVLYFFVASSHEQKFVMSNLFQMVKKQLFENAVQLFQR